LIEKELLKTMAKQKKGEGFHSSAGLIRYFDAEEKTAIKIPPWFVIALSIATIVVVTAVHLTIKL
jgi:preprotein translocase subunit Sec61beta